MKPSSGTKVLHNRHVHPTGFHLLIFCLDSTRLDEAEQVAKFLDLYNLAIQFPNKLPDNF